MAPRTVERKGPTSGQRLQRGTSISGRFLPTDSSSANPASPIRHPLCLVLFHLLRFHKSIFADLHFRLHVDLDRVRFRHDGRHQRVHRRVAGD